MRTTLSASAGPRSLVALVLAGGLVAAACNGEPEAPAPDPAPEVAEEVEPEPDDAGPERVYTEADLEDIVLGPAEAPEGTEHLETYEGPDAVATTIENLGVEQELDDVQVGVVGGRASVFVGPELAAVVGSWGAVYEDPEAAAGALEAVVEGLGADPGLGDPEPEELGLGEEGAVIRGTPEDFPEGFDHEEIHIVWRTGNLLLWVIGSPYEEGELGDIAEEMAARAA